MAFLCCQVAFRIFLWLEGLLSYVWVRSRPFSHIINATRKHDTDNLIGSCLWSSKIDFSKITFIVLSPSQYVAKWQHWERKRKIYEYKTVLFYWFLWTICQIEKWLCTGFDECSCLCNTFLWPLCFGLVLVLSLYKEDYLQCLKCEFFWLHGFCGQWEEWVSINRFKHTY